MKKQVIGSLLCGLCAAFIVGCGTAATTTTDSTTASPNVGATATVCAQQRGQFGGASNGTIQSVSGDGLTLTTRQGNTVSISYSSTTTITRQQLVDASALQEGGRVTVGVKQNADNTYTATRISLSNGATATGFGGGTGRGTGQRANTACFAARGNGARGGQGGTTGANATNSRAISGTVGQVSNNILTVTDTSGDDYSINLTQTTQIVETSKVDGSALQKGQTITVTGKKSGSTTVAQAIVITLPGGLGQQATPTPTSTK